MSGLELATGYVSLVTDASQIAKDIDKALAQGSRNVDKVGSSIGSKLGGALQKTLTASAVATGGAVATVVGTALTKGWQRLSAIDNAQGKLKALGNDAQSTSKIMDSAMASVKGTAYGLGDAATIAASAVAAGIAPGKDLTKYLSSIGDAAAIAGTDLADMGSIFNQVQTGQTAYTDDLNQLADRGIPIYQWLAQEAGVAASEVKDLASKGKISSEMFFSAIDKNIGGAAKSVDTVSAAWSNTMAALGRAGAAALGPTFDRLKPALSGTTSLIDEATPKIKDFFEALDNRVFDDWAPKVMEFGTSVRESFDQLRNSPMAVGSIERVKDVLSSLVDVGHEILPSVGAIGKSLAQASAATGISSWQILLSTLEAVAPILDATLVPALQLTADLMSSNQAAVTALALGFAAFKTIPAVVGRVGTALEPVTGRIDSARTSLRGFGDTMKLQQHLAGMSGQSLSRMGAAMGALGSHVPAIGRMQMAYRNAADGASAFARTQGVVAASMGAAKSGVSSLMGFLGGPLGATLMGATLAFANWNSGVQKAASQQRILAESATNAATQQQSLMEAMASGDAAATTSQLVSNISSLRQEQAQLADTGPSMLQRSVAGWDRLGNAIGITRGETYEAWSAQKDVAGSSGAVARTLDTLKVSNEGIATAVSGTTDEYLKLRTQMSATGEDGKAAARWLDDQRTKYDQTRRAMEKIGPAGVELTAALAQIGDAAGDSDQKLDGLKRALQALGIMQSDAQEEMFETATMVRKLKEEAASGWDPAGGLGLELLDGDGLDGTLANTEKLDASLKDLGGQYQRLVASGVSGADAWHQISGGLEALSEASKISVEDLARVGAHVGGLIPPDLADTLLAPVTSTEQAITQLKVRSEELSKSPINMRIEDEGVRNAIRDIEGLKVEATDTPGIVKVTADNQEAIDRLKAVKIESDFVGNLTAVPRVDLHTELFQQKRDHATRLIEYLDAQEPSPEADLIIDKLKTNKAISDEEIDALTKRVADPSVKLEIQKALEDANRINQAITDAARARTATITIESRTGQIASGLLSAGIAMAQSQEPVRRADGGPVFGAGGRTSDSIHALLSNDEHVWTADEVDAVGGHRAMYGMRAAARSGALRAMLPAFASGGAVGAAIDAVRGVEGNTYLWGGTGPIRFDCSGLVGWVQQILMGFGKETSRIYTTYSLIAGQTAGLVRGLNSASPFNVGVSEDHMAATLDGHAIESGGAHGTSGIDGGRARAEDSQFPYKFHLPVSLIAGGLDSRTDARYASYYGAAKPEWTDEDEMDLREARIAVTQAIESRDEAYKSDKKSPADRDSADLKVERAQLKVRELEGKRDGTGAPTVTPAPELTGQMDEDAITLRRAELAVLDAQLARDKEYSDPDATGADKEKADIAVYEAKNALAETRRRLAGGDGPRLKSAKEVGQDLVGFLIDGVFEELGLSGSVFADPSRLTEPDTSETGGYTTRELAKPRTDGFRPAPMFPSAQDLISQLPFTPGHQSPEETARLFDGSFGPLPAGNPPWLDKVLASGGGQAFEDLLRRNPFDRGGRASGIGLLPKAILKPERVLEPRTTENFERLTTALDSGALLERLEVPAGTGAGGGNTFAPVFQGTDNQQMFAMFERWFRHIQRGGGQQTRARTSRRR